MGVDVKFASVGADRRHDVDVVGGVELAILTGELNSTVGRRKDRLVEADEVGPEVGTWWATQLVRERIHRARISNPVGLAILRRELADAAEDDRDFAGGH